MPYFKSNELIEQAKRFCGHPKSQVFGLHGFLIDEVERVIKRSGVMKGSTGPAMREQARLLIDIALNFDFDHQKIKDAEMPDEDWWALRDRIETTISVFEAYSGWLEWQKNLKNPLRRFLPLLETYFERR